MSEFSKNTTNYLAFHAKLVIEQNIRKIIDATRNIPHKSLMFLAISLISFSAFFMLVEYGPKPCKEHKPVFHYIAIKDCPQKRKDLKSNNYLIVAAATQSA